MSMQNVLLAGAIALGLGVAGAGAGHAAQILHDAAGGYAGPVVLAQAVINNRNVAAVTYTGGSLTRGPDGVWTEHTDDGRQFTFQELGADETTLYLLDPSRDLQLALDVSRNLVLFSFGGDNFQDMATITGVFAGPAGALPASPGGAAVSETITYSCNEEIPLVARYVSIGDDHFAHVSHDIFPEVAMTLRPIGGEMVFVDATGTHTLRLDRARVIFTFNGSEDHCFEI